MSEITFDNGTIVISFDTWEDFDANIANIAGFYSA